jgi:hypothetical protein
MAANTADLGKLVAAAIAPTMAEYGLPFPSSTSRTSRCRRRSRLRSTSAPRWGWSAIWASSPGISAAEAMTRAAAQPGGGGAMGAGVGAGLGMAMAGQLGQAGPWGAAPAGPVAPSPPPPPVERVWHIAENGATRGPFSRAALGRMAADGGLTRATLVWTAGQDGWQAAGDIAELAQLFTVMPPPPPPPVAG